MGWETSSGRSGLSRVIQVMAVRVVLAAAYLVFASSGAAYVESKNRCRFSGIYNFGDSNSDTGSDSATFGRVRPPNGETFFGKASGRDCDGRLVIDFVAESLGFPYLVSFLDSIGADFSHGANFAAAGATIQNQDAKLCLARFSPLTLPIQISQFEQFRDRTVETYGKGKDCNSRVPLPEPESFSKALFTIDIGQNDLDVGLNSMTEDQVKASIPRIIDEFSASVQKLYELGARAFWIHNTGPLGCLPKFFVKHPPALNNTDPNGCVRSYNEVAQEFNRQLKEKVFRLRTQLHVATLVYVDIYSVKYSLISQGNIQGFPNLLRQCCGEIYVVGCGEKAMVNGTEVYGDACSNPSKYIIWDGIHFTEAANKWVASHILGGDFSEPKVAIDEGCYDHPSMI